MSAIQFIESQSSDPVERAIAERVVSILNSPRMDSARRQWLVQQAQQELMEHRRRLERAQQKQSARSKASRPKRDPMATRRRELGRTGDTAK